MKAINIYLHIGGKKYKIGTPPQNEKIYYLSEECIRIGDPIVKNRPSLGVADWESIFYRHAGSNLIFDEEGYRTVVEDYISFLQKNHNEFIENGAEFIELSIWMYTTSNEVQCDLLMPSEIIELEHCGITSITFDVIHYSKRSFRNFIKKQR